MNDLEKFSFADLVAIRQAIKETNWKDDEMSKFTVGLLMIDVDEEIGKRLNTLLVNRTAAMEYELLPSETVKRLINKS